MYYKTQTLLQYVGYYKSDLGRGILTLQLQKNKLISMETVNIVCPNLVKLLDVIVITNISLKALSQDNRSYSLHTFIISQSSGMTDFS